jgi:hypothetical protein
MGGEVEAIERSVSKSAVSRTFIERTRETLHGLMRRRLDDVRLAMLMLDGIDSRTGPTWWPSGSPPRA